MASPALGNRTTTTGLPRASAGTDARATAIPSVRALFGMAFAASAVAGVAQIALLRELAANHVLSSLGLSIRLVVAVVLAAHGIGAALAPRVAKLDDASAVRALGRIGWACGLYTAALLFALLRWLGPGVEADAVTPVRLLILGAALSPPFVGFGLAIAWCTARVQAIAPGRVGALVALTLTGSALGIFAAHAGSSAIGVDVLLLAAALSAPAALSRRPALGLASAFVVLAAAGPLAGALEAQRAARPSFQAPVSERNTRHVHTGWSTLQKLDLYLYQESVLLGFHNGFWQWWVAPSLSHTGAFPGYERLYRPAWFEGRDALVIGSGAGMGLLHLERARPRSITAVELDAEVLRLARGPFAAYSGAVYERVPAHAVEGRAFLDATGQRFDLVVYEGSFLTAAHPSVAVSAENHLYTREGIALALERLRPGGLGLVMFAGPEAALARIAASARAAGAAVEALHLTYPGTLWWELPVLVFGREAERVRAFAADVVEAAGGSGTARAVALDSARALPLSDARPFLYLGSGRPLGPLAVAGAASLLLFVALLARPGPRRLRLVYFALGAGFMLVEYAVLARLRSFLGDPVITAFAALLLILGGMALGSAFGPALLARRRAFLASACIGALALGSIALLEPPHTLPLLDGRWMRAVWLGALLVPAGALLGVFFPLGLRGQPEAAVPTAYAYDALGSVAGFFLFHALAFVFGIPAAFGAGALAYVVVIVALVRR